MLNPKQVVSGLIAQHVGFAKDNLYRAKVSFQNFTLKELEQQHGESGKTRAQILGAYSDAVRDAEAVKAWFDKL